MIRNIVSKIQFKKLCSRQNNTQTTDLAKISNNLLRNRKSFDTHEKLIKLN